jgi:hypothetical protein
MRMSTTMATLFLVSALLLCASVAAYSFRAALLAGSADAAACTRYTVEPGDTLTNIAWRYHTTIWTLARANGIGNVNLIFVNQRLCIPSRGHRAVSAGITANGTVRWYAYDALCRCAIYSTGLRPSIIFPRASYWQLPGKRVDGRSM